MMSQDRKLANEHLQTITQHTMEYFGLPTSNRERDMVFAMRDLNFRRVNRIADIPITPLPVQGSFYYRALSGNIAHLMHSTEKGIPSPVFDGGPEDMIKLSKVDILPMPRFTIAIVSSLPLTAAMITTNGLEKVFISPIHKNTYLKRKIANVDIPALLSSLKMPNGTINFDIGHKAAAMSLKGVMAVSTLSRLARLFLQSQVPSTDDGTEMKNRYAKYDETLVDGDSKYPKIKDSVVVVGKDLASDWGIDDDTKYSIPWILVPKLDPDDYISTPAYAREVPSHIFPFIRKTLPAEEYAVDVAARHFARIFSKSEESQNRAMGEIRNGFKSAALSVHGEIITHIYLGIQMAIDTGGFLNLLGDGEQYLGFQLCTEQDIISNGKLRVPIGDTEIRTTVSVLQTSSVARGLVATLLSGLVMQGEKTKKVIVLAEDIASSVSLVHEISLRKRAAPALLTTEIITALKYLGYIEDVLHATAENVISILTDIIEKKVSQAPMAISATLFTEENIVYSSNLARCGHESISFFNPGGKTRLLFQDPSDDPMMTKKKVNVTKTTGKGRKKKSMQETEEIEVFGWRFIRVSRVDLATAIMDFHIMVTEKKIAQLEIEAGRALANIATFVVDQGKSPVLDALRRFGFESGSAPAAGKKRKGEYIEKEVKGTEISAVENDSLSAFHIGF